MAEQNTPIDPLNPDYIPPWIDSVDPVEPAPEKPPIDSAACEREWRHLPTTRHRRMDCPVEIQDEYESESERAFMAQSPDHRAAL